MFFKIAKSDYQLRLVSLSIHMEQLGCQWMDFCDIWYLNLFWKSAEKIQVLLYLTRINRYFTWRPKYIFDHILCISFHIRIRNVALRSCRENRNTICSL